MNFVDRITAAWNSLFFVAPELIIKSPTLPSAPIQPSPAIRAAMSTATGQWEGWERNRLRRRPPGRLVAQDTDQDLGTREQMISEARSLCQTFPLAKSIIRKYANHVVGTCEARWNTGDPAIDKIYEDNWTSRMTMLDADSKHHFVKLARLIVSSEIRDGDIFVQLIDTGQIKLIEADRVNSGSGGIINIDTDEMIGGIKINLQGQPISYRVMDRTRFGTYKNPIDRAANEIVHVYDPDRIDAYRGVTGFDCALNFLRDLKEAIDAERGAMKLNSKIALLVKTVMGSSKGRTLFSNEDSTAGSAKVDVEEINDLATAYMFPNEDLKAHRSDRPAGEWREFALFLVQLIAIGLDLPLGVVWAMLGTGPAVRFEIAQAQRTFAIKRDVLEKRFLNRVCGWVTARDISAGQIPFSPNWSRFRFQRPPGITIDIGRDSKAGIDENKAGLLTATEWFDEAGDDFFEATETLAKEAAFRRTTAQKFGIPLEDIRMLSPNQMTASGPEQTKPAEQLP